MAASIIETKPIEAGWSAIKDSLGPGAPLTAMRLAFFLGANHLFNCVLPKDPTTISIVELHELILIDKELELFVKDLRGLTEQLDSMIKAERARRQARSH